MKTPFQKVNRPTLVEVQQAFELIDQMFTDLLTGEVLVAIVGQVEQVVFRTTAGDYLPSLPALEGWISCWSRFAEGFGFMLDQTPLRELVQQLYAIEDDYDRAHLLDKELVYAATQVIAKQRAIYRRLDVYKVRELSRQEVAAIQTEEQAHAQ